MLSNSCFFSFQLRTISNNRKDRVSHVGQAVYARHSHISKCRATKSYCPMGLCNGKYGLFPKVQGVFKRLAN